MRSREQATRRPLGSRSYASPAGGGRQVSDWFQTGGSYFAVEKVTAVMDPRGARWEVPFWRMPLTVLLDEILSAGFRLERLVEHVPPPHTRDIDARLYRRLMDEPAFLALRLRRV